MESDSDEEVYTDCNELLESALLYDKNLQSITKIVRDSGKKVRVYPIKQRVGFALLLASDRTLEHKQRNTFLKDLQLMERSLKSCQWCVESPCLPAATEGGVMEVHLGRKGFENILDGLLRSSDVLEPYSCFMFYYSGHGTAECVLLSDGEQIPYKDIVSMVSSIPSLTKKPKIFIFDCCRQGSSKRGSLSFGSELEERNCVGTGGYPPEHCLIAFSAAEESSAVGIENAPSVFTLQLAHALPDFRCRLSFAEILSQVAGMTRMIAQSVNRDQRPVYCSTLTSLLMLSGKCVCVCVCVCAELSNR